LTVTENAWHDMKTQNYKILVEETLKIKVACRFAEYCSKT